MGKPNKTESKPKKTESKNLRAPDAPWYSEGLSFECTGCGKCCSGAPGFVWVDEQEIRELATHLKMEVEHFENKFVRQVGNAMSLVEYPDGDCIFLDPVSRHCTVYEHRPIQCRTWPFWNSNLETKRDWKDAALDCPGCNQGKLYSLKEIESARQQRDV